MTKTLFLLRHAHAQPFVDEASDFSRELTSQGRSAASAVGRWLRRRELASSTWLSSPAMRAKQTAELALLAAGVNSALTFVATIYSGNAEALLDLLVQGVAQECTQVVLVGHNPTIEHLAALLLSSDERQQATPQFDPATLVELAYDGDWNKLTPGCATWIQSVAGRSLAAATF